LNPAILLYALQVLQMIPTLIATGQSVVGLINQSSAAIQNMIAEHRDPTPAEWDALNQTITALRTQLHSPK
jgi:hypothetical protein